MSTAAERKAQYEGSALEALMKSVGHEICNRCWCCNLVWEHSPCWQCLGLQAEDIEDDYCSVCAGTGELSWQECIGRCNENGEHAERAEKGNK